MDRLKRNFYILEALQKLSKKQRKEVLKNITLDQLKFLVEISYNLLKNNIKIDDITREKVKKNKKYLQNLRKLACKNTSLTEKKKIIISGGFLPLLLSTLASTALSTLIEKIFEKKSNDEKSQRENN